MRYECRHRTAQNTHLASKTNVRNSVEEREMYVQRYDEHEIRARFHPILKYKSRS